MYKIKEIRFIIGDPEKGPLRNLDRHSCSQFGIDYGKIKLRGEYIKLYPVVRETTTLDNISYSAYPRMYCANNKHRRLLIEHATKTFGLKSSIRIPFTIIDNRTLSTSGALLKRKRYEKLGFRYHIPEGHFDDEVLHTGTRIAIDDPVRWLGIPRNVEIDGNYINGVKVMNDDNDIKKRKFTKEMERRMMAGESYIELRAELNDKYNIKINEKTLERVKNYFR